MVKALFKSYYLEYKKEAKCLETQRITPGHQINTHQALQTPHPDIFLFNLQWDPMAPETSAEILKIMLSIPNSFETDDLYNARRRTRADREARRQVPGIDTSTYAFRGIIVFQLAHY